MKLPWQIILLIAEGAVTLGKAIAKAIRKARRKKELSDEEQDEK